MMSCASPLLLSSLLLVATACTSLQRTASGGGRETPKQAGGSAVSTGPAAETSGALARALEDRLAGRSSLPVRIAAECLDEAGFRAVEIFDDGVAIWDRRAQFTLSDAEIHSLLEAFKRADFAHLEELYGGSKGPEPEPPAVIHETPPSSAVRIVCRVALTVGEVVKQSAQRQRGEQSEALRALATEILDACEGPARQGITAADLTDGLRKVARGELAPQTLSVLAHRKPEPAGAGEDSGWLLRLEGRRAKLRRYDDGGELLDAAALELDPGSLAELAARLADQSLEDLPGNLWAGDYIDLSVRVLDREKRIQARQFAGMTETTHGEQQDRFDAAFEALRAVSREAARAGTPAGG